MGKMIISKISDGLGNQLFMYACGYAISKRLNTELILDGTILATNPNRKFELDKLKVDYDKIIMLNAKHKTINRILRLLINIGIKSICKSFIEENPYGYDERILSLEGNIYLQGYFQSDKYFREYRDDLLSLFQPAYDQSYQCKQYIAEVENSNSVAIHIRRGDYGDGIKIGLDYYKKAINNVKRQVENPMFFVFSDDIDAAQELLKNELESFTYVHYQSENPTLDDFFIMKTCKHQIIGNSSYSWWAAWLNENQNKIVICPDFKQWSGDFYPYEWIKIQCN